MKSKSLAILAGILALIASSYVTRKVIDRIHSEPSIAADILSRPWVGETIGSAGVVFSLPWHLQRQPSSMPSNVARLVTTSTTLSHEGDGLNIMAMHLAFVPGTPLSLEGAADGAVANLKRLAGTEAVEGSKSETSIVGQRAFTIDVKVQREFGGALRMRGVVFTLGPELYQLILVCRDDQPVAPMVWQKMLHGIRITPAS